MHIQPSEQRVRDIGLAGIACLPGRRVAQPEAVNVIAQSMKEIGLINPITIRPVENGMGFYLIAGRHRYEAAKQLKWESIQAIVLEGLTADEAELREIDENLVRTTLTPAEESLVQARRKEIYENQHPETKQHVAGGKSGGRGRKHSKEQNVPSYSQDASNKTGKGKETIKRAVRRKKQITKIADVIGTSLDKGEELDALAKMTPERQEEIIEKAKSGEDVSAKTELKKERRETREAELAAIQLAMPDKVYGVIYADPPWRFDPYSRDTGLDRAADNHYPTMRAYEVAALKIPAAEDAVLFIWATAPMMPEALEVMNTWGFEYRSQFIWVKDKLGTGYWNRNKHEMLLIGTRGNIPAPAPGTQYPSVIEAQRGAHSAKPFAFREMIEHMFPTLPRIELFARERFEGWDAYGNEIPQVAA